MMIKKLRLSHRHLSEDIKVHSLFNKGMPDDQVY